jgi:hypothetical protein
MSKRTRLAVAAALALFPAVAAAQSAPPDGEHHGPRPEAIAACKEKGDGDACEFDAPHGHIAGTCHKDRAGDLACMHPHHHHSDGGATP